MRTRGWLVAFGLLGLGASGASAHPVPRENHDRTVRVSLAPVGDRVVMRVAYRLEVDELTVILDDMAPFKDEVDPGKFANRGLDYYGQFARIYGSILAKHLNASLGDRELAFAVVGQKPSLVDDEGKDLGHLRVDFVFEATAPAPTAGGAVFAFRDGTYLLQKGEIRVHFETPGAWDATVLAAPDEALQKRPEAELRPGDDDRLRELKVALRPRADASVAPPVSPVSPAPPVLPTPARPGAERHSLLRLLQEHESGWLLLVAASAAFGAAHALTPGHGKTLVAAYLVGQRGTTFHAVFLGLVTTLTHTGAVLVLAGIIHFWGLTPAARAWIQATLPLALGLTIVCFGFYLLLQRLAGRADHFHVGGGHHHHGPDGSRVPLPSGDAVTWSGLTLLGVTGGIVPCWDAIVMLVWAIGMDLVAWALPMLLAFSLGLAGVLVALGVAVVKVRDFADARLGDGPWVKRLPLLSALAIVALGFYLCAEAVRTPTEGP